MNENARYRTLRDYVRVLRTQRLLIVGVTIVFGAAAFLVSTLQTKEYTAETSLSFRDVGSDLDLVGEGTIPELAPDQRAAVNANRITRPEVANEVRKELGTELTTEQVQNSIDTEVGARTNFVIIKATSENAEFAARLANAYGDQVQELDLAEVRKRIDKVIDGLRDTIEDAKGGTAAEEFLTAQVNQTRIAQLQTARELARPVEVAREAETPGSPSSPRTRRNTALGLIVGLALGLLAAFLRDSLDRRLRKTDEVQSELHLPVIGRVPADAFGEVAFANGAGKDAVDHLESFRVLRKNLEFLQAGKPLRSVLVTSGLPEEGKSTVAMALAGASAVAGKRTLLVECDLRRPSLADRLGLQPEPGLTDYLVGQATPEDVLQVVKLISPAGVNGPGREENADSEAEPSEEASLVCIPAGSTAPLPAELLGSERFTDFLANVSEAYDLVVLDTSPILSVVDALELVPRVDGVVVCVRLGRTTREEAHAAREALGHLPDRPTGVVVTGVRAEDESYYGYHYAYSSEAR